MDPHTIETVRFKTTRVKVGYEADEVDAFLDQVASTLRDMKEKAKEREAVIVQLKRQVAEQVRMLDDYDAQAHTEVLKVEPDGVAPVTATLILEAAQRTADDVIAQAQRQAVDITSRADESARERADEILADVAKRRDVVQGKVADLEMRLAQAEEVRSKLRATMRNVLARMEED